MFFSLIFTGLGVLVFAVHQLAIWKCPLPFIVVSIDCDFGNKVENEHVLTNNKSTSLNFIYNLKLRL